MKQLVKQLVLLATMLPTTVSAMAYDFESDGICYNIISEEDRTVEVTYENSSSYWNYNYSDIEGSIVIPPKVIYQSKTYTVTSIADNAFRGCDVLTSVTLPDGLYSIGNEAFSYCLALTDIEVDPGNQNYASLDGVLHNKDLSELICYPAGKTETNYNIHNSVTSIGTYAFSGCDALTSVTLPDSLYSIGDRVFSYCSSLTSVTFSDGLHSIGDQAFYNCDALTSATLPDGLHSIGDQAFYNCDALTSVTFPDSLYSIGDRVFSYCNSLTSATLPDGLHSIGDRVFCDCSSLTSVTFPDSLYSIGYQTFINCTALTSVTLPDGLYSIEYQAFYNCDALTSVTFPDGLHSIENSAFDNCDALTSVTLPDGLYSIGNYAFYNCNALTSVTLPDGLHSIGDQAFSYCNALTQVYCKASVPPSASINAFYDNTLMGTLYVPIGCKDEYMAVDPWRNFWTIEEFDFQSSGVENAMSDSGISIATDGSSIIVNGEPAGRIEVYTTGGQCAYSGTDRTIGNLAKGAYIVKAGNQTFKIIL